MSHFVGRCKHVFTPVRCSLQPLGEAQDHFIFTRNILPRVEQEVEGKTLYLSPNDILESRKLGFNLKHLVAFGTQVTCFIPKERRKGVKKTPGKLNSYDGIILGYTENMQAYIVWDIVAKKKREVSFFHTIVHEGFFPYRDKKIWRKEDKDLPISYSPRLEDFLVE